ncbi:autotransporter family protein [Desulfovibrio piger]|uniref:autotransporter family protein n=1 Tax=Desulfovibrio piger TaxID=901 RepID=UPI0026EC6169|nr:autotransporter domain-containing protein [Desulfovibrio piger]
MGAEGDLTLNNVDLKGNNANFGGAIWNEGTLTVNGGSFEGNTADEAAGAIYNAVDATLKVDRVTFANNSSAKAGAINNYNGTVVISDSTFKGNAAGTSMGGAVTNTSGSAPGKSIITITGSTFEGNKAGNGGAVWNGTYGTVDITDSTFKGNTAVAEGGLGQGGAITNAGQMTIKGTNTFSGNTAAKGKDIYNSGTLTMTSDSHLIVDGNQNIYNADGATLTVKSGAKLTITDAVAGGNYEVVTGVGETAIDKGAWSGDNLQSSSDMVVLTFTDGKTFTAEGRDAHDVFTGLDDSMGDAVNSLYARHGAAGTNGWNYADVDAEERGIRFLSRATDKRFIGADHQAAAATIESAARIAFAGAVPQMTKMASDAASNAVVNRLGFANPADGAQAIDAEGKIVDRNTTGFALWIAPLWQNQHGWGMEADSMDYGFNGNLGGVSLGADYTFENAIRAGITFNIGGGYAESSGGDLNSTENNMSFWGLGAYAGWNYENFGLMADVSYTSTWNDLKQDLDSRMGMGDLEADVQASAISAGLRAEYKLETSVLDIIPHIGVRYMSLNTWGYDVDADGGTVLEGDGFHQDIWTFPVGVTFSKDITLDSGWFFKPSVDFSVIPAAGDIKAKSEVAFTGLPGTYEVETQMMDYLTWQGGVGLEMGNDTMSFGVNYTLQAGQHTTGHGVFGSFRYEF